MKRRIGFTLAAVAIGLAMMTFLELLTAAEARGFRGDDAHCLAVSGEGYEDATNTCGHKIVAAWWDPEYGHGSWMQTYFAPGETSKYLSLVKSVHVFVCDARNGGIKSINGRPVGCEKYNKPVGATSSSNKPSSHCFNNEQSCTNNCLAHKRYVSDCEGASAGGFECIRSTQGYCWKL
jgi:hypothetical protein